MGKWMGSKIDKNPIQVAHNIVRYVIDKAISNV